MATTGTFGSVLAEQMIVTQWNHGAWSAPELGPLRALSIHPAAHALHYGSSCFEGLKAHRGVDGIVRLFRLDAHVRRMQESAEALVLPAPDADTLSQMIVDLVGAVWSSVPESPGSLYVRPTLIGTEANIGSAARPSDEAILYVLASPVGDYFQAGTRSLVLSVETGRPRTTLQFGKVKTGANYAMALRQLVQATERDGADQVLFAPDGQVEETGASNFVLIDGECLITPKLMDSFLHGVTRDSLLVIAADLGYAVEERSLSIGEVIDRAARPGTEAALTGTAAVLSPVGQLILDRRRITIGDGRLGPHTTRLRGALTDLQTARHPDHHGWLTPVHPSDARAPSETSNISRL